MTREDVVNMLEKFGRTKEVELCLLIEKNGDIIESGGEDVFYHLETISMMAATIYGAANTANKQLEKEPPEDILIGAEDGHTIVKSVDNNRILVVRTENKEDIEKVKKHLKIAKNYILKHW